MKQFDQKYWDERYLANETGWDAGMVTTPLKEYFDQLKNKDLKILIPGAGSAYEAEYLQELGFKNVFVADISPVAVERMKEKLNKNLHILLADFFEINEKFDLIIEQTFFCALHPSQRKDYVSKAYSLLNKNGRLAGVLFNREFPGGPPFGGSIEEYRTLFSEKFKIKTLEKCYNSIKPRMGSEVFFILEKI